MSLGPILHCTLEMVICTYIVFLHARVLQLRRKVHITDSEISRRNSEIVHGAFATWDSSPSDSWLLEDSTEPEITPVIDQIN